MAKRKPVKLWIAHDPCISRDVCIWETEPDWIDDDDGDGYWGSASTLSVGLCREGIERLLGERLRPWPYLAEIEVPPFKIVRYWEPMYEEFNDGEA